ncbi:ATP-binding protein [Streptomyces zingiberis]|uniref:ATP-binding protein n=1 Tax=Streptomyces zingiberis TaxID=2053010 RepID=A0ABX1BQ85_9ACTN|nr:ATP-binding protein [Streptomyces zingiberis]NJP99881.1 ATP-binding protein [Streptomyces zingiberis]
MTQEITRTENSAQARQFSVRLSATRRGARRARRLAVAQLCTWGLPYETVEQIVAELAANAVLHGHVPGRDFRLTLCLPEVNTLRIEIADARGDRLPPATVPGPHPRTEGVDPRAEGAPDAESGRGLLIVAALADRWGVVTGPPPRKTVWAELALPGDR